MGQLDIDNFNYITIYVDKFSYIFIFAHNKDFNCFGSLKNNLLREA